MRLLAVGDGHLALEGFVEGDQCFGACQAQGLELVVNDGEQVVVVARVELDEHIVLAGREMALHYLGNLCEGLRYALERGGVFQVYSYVGTGFVAYFFGVDHVLAAFQDAHLPQSLYALVYGRSRHVACTGYFEERDTGIVGYEFEDLSV